MLLDLFTGGMDNFAINLLSFLILFPALLLSLSAHEFAHGYAAYKQGDGYAKMMGRLSLNPLKHLDPIGTLLLFVCGFGWAKPVPIVPSNFKNGKKSMLIVSFAGILTNIIIAFISVFFLYFLTFVVGIMYRTGMAWQIFGTVIYSFFSYLAIININLAVFNLLPIPPLDGYKIFRELFASKLGYTFFANIERYSNLIMIIIIVASSRLGIISGISGAVYSGLNYLMKLIFSAFTFG